MGNGSHDAGPAPAPRPEESVDELPSHAGVVEEDETEKSTADAAASAPGLSGLTLTHETTTAPTAGADANPDYVNDSASVGAPSVFSTGLSVHRYYLQFFEVDANGTQRSTTAATRIRL